jgi:hypothetical protein
MRSRRSAAGNGIATPVTRACATWPTKDFASGLGVGRDLELEDAVREALVTR